MPDNRRVQRDGSVSSNVQNIEGAVRRLRIHTDGKEDNGSMGFSDRSGEPDCIFYLRTSMCGYGNSCRFNHPTHIGQANQLGGDLPERAGEPDCVVLLKQDGFSSDLKEQKVVAKDDLWDAYIKAHSQARSYRAKSMPNFKDLESIFGSAIINGSQSNNLVEDAGAKTGSHHSRTHWTPPMDCYLINLLLGQVNRGNRIGQIFVAQAWIDIVNSFNANFSSDHDKGVLKNRYKQLKKQYNDINTLLGAKGFSWDDAREMVATEDHVWDSYIRAHPDARPYRIKTVPN